MTDTHPQKVFKYCPKCGSVEFKITGPRSFKCDDCGFVFYINSSAAVAAIIFNQEGKMLFTRRAVDPDKGKLDLPGGFVDPMESAEQALEREIKEELGVPIVSKRYIGSFPNEYIFSGLSIFTTDLAFITEVDSLENIKAMDDISGVEFYYPEDVDMAELPSKSMQKIVQQIIKNK